MSDFKRCIFDIETDGLLDTVSQVWSIVIMDADTEEMASYHGTDGIVDALSMLGRAEEVIGHNIIDYDLPVLEKVAGFILPRDDVIVTDTLICTRLIYPDMKNDDFRKKPVHLPIRLYGSHSLEAWGLRLGERKDDFGKHTDWQCWSEEMQAYCEQDVRVTKRLLDMIEAKQYSKEALYIEHAFQHIIVAQKRFGFCFDEEAAIKLYGELVGEREGVKRQLQDAFPPIIEEREFIPKVNNAKLGYRVGVPIMKRSVEAFNPSSRTHIAKRLKERYGWIPVEYTDNGAPKIDDDVLSSLPYPEAPLLSRYLLINKRLGQLVEGQQAWLKVLSKQDGRIHGEVVTNGAITGRCTHHHPNIAQVPAVGTEYGVECRKLFRPPDGYVQLGCDASGLELRCLAHYMQPFDEGEYAREVLDGDIHTKNQIAAGLSTRNEAKRFIYAMLYGAGDALIGSLVDAGLKTERERVKLGKEVKQRFLKNTPALARLLYMVQEKVKRRGYLVGLDGRILPARASYSALNLLLQSAGAVVMKRATIILWDKLRDIGYTFGEEVAQMAHIHDEYQLAVREDIDPHSIGAIAVSAIKEAGAVMGFRCPLDGEYKIGHDWADCH